MTRTIKPTATASRACAGKVRHVSRAAAHRHMARLIRNGAAACALNVYECPNRRHGEARHWHVGHRPGAGGG